MGPLHSLACLSREPRPVAAAAPRSGRLRRPNDGNAVGAIGTKRPWLRVHQAQRPRDAANDERSEPCTADTTVVGLYLHPHRLATIAPALAEHGAQLGEVATIRSDDVHAVLLLSLRSQDDAHTKEVVDVRRGLPGVGVREVTDLVLDCHLGGRVHQHNGALAFPVLGCGALQAGSRAIAPERMSPAARAIAAATTDDDLGLGRSPVVDEATRGRSQSGQGTR